MGAGVEGRGGVKGGAVRERGVSLARDETGPARVERTVSVQGVASCLVTVTLARASSPWAVPSCTWRAIFGGGRRGRDALVL